MKRYNPSDVESKWQKIWDETGIYTANLKSDKPKYIAMSMFNYPSGAGIHIGHAMNYTISDVKARFKRQQGYESYHPVGWDAFGLPAENYAIKAGVSPQESMAKIIPGYHKQYKAMGWSNDWEKEIATHLPEYYKWTQWIFSQMYKNKLAYQDSRMQWWCTKCQTVLANEQVIDGKCWRHDGADDPEVSKKEVKQWFFKITEYAEELLEATDALDWTESVKTAQKKWIGKSKGAEIDFAIATNAHRSDAHKEELSNGTNSTSQYHAESNADSDAVIVDSDGSVSGSARKQNDTAMSIRVFTTRPDTLYGATFMILAPEHELVSKITTSEQKDKVDEYVKNAERKSEVERQAAKEKTGVFTGAYAVNPANDENIPIWIADYVLAGYGTGAIMAVPAHDERDNEFAQKFNLPIKKVVMREHTDKLRPHRDGAQISERDVAQSIVKHPNEDKYLLLKLKGWDTETYSLPTGGVESSESTKEAALRELKEEAGYTDIKSVKDAPSAYIAKFFHEFKNVNVKGTFHTFIIELESLDQVEVSDEEKSKHDMEWVSLKQLHDKLDGQGVIPIISTYKDGTDNIETAEGEIINSGEYNGMLSSEAREKIVADLAKKGVAKEKVNYKMRDWSVSRQRYWGAPIPIVNCDKCGTVLVPDSQLPVELPELTDFQPSGDGRSALARATDWLKTTCPQCGGEAERETDTLDTYICSSWYMLRYFEPHNQENIFESDVVNKWMPIDFYNGGDHATAHMLYARFVTRFFNKLGLVDNPEPFKQFLFNGKVRAADGSAFSKSKGNGIDPLEVIESGYGADALRMYLMFAAPLEFNVRWDSQGVPGTFRFLTRLWNLVQDYNESQQNELSEKEHKAILAPMHAMVKKATIDIEENRYNTAIASVMAGLNALYKNQDKLSNNDTWAQALDMIVASVAPFAPHIADELWQQLGHSSSVNKDSWPEFDEKYLSEDTVTIVVQINGKVRANISAPNGSDQANVEKLAKADAKIAEHTKDGIKKVIYVPNKLINFVV